MWWNSKVIQDAGESVFELTYKPDWRRILVQVGQGSTGKERIVGVRGLGWIRTWGGWDEEVPGDSEYVVICKELTFILNMSHRKKYILYHSQDTCLCVCVSVCAFTVASVFCSVPFCFLKYVLIVPIK